MNILLLQNKENVTKLIIYIIKHYKTFIYMLRIAGQTAGPIGLVFFVDTDGWTGMLQA